MPELDQRLLAWTSAGLITPEQATSIAEHERTRPPAQPSADAGVRPEARRARRARRGTLAEAVGYVGAALALAAIGLLVSDVWPELAVGGQLALVGLLTVIAVGAGSAVHGQPAAAMQRLTGVLWAAAGLGAAWFAGIVAVDVLGAGPAATGASVGLVATLVAVPLLLRCPALPLHLVTLAGMVTTATSALAMSALQPDVFWHGMLVSAIGGAWLLLGRGGWLAPGSTPEVLGGLLALIGAQVGSFGDLRGAALTLGVLIAAGLVALAVAREASAHLIVAALGLFVLVPELVFEVFGDAIGAPATLLVVGLLLVLLAVGLGRARREVGADPDAPAPSGGPPRDADDRPQPNPSGGSR